MWTSSSWGLIRLTDWTPPSEQPSRAADEREAAMSDMKGSADAAASEPHVASELCNKPLGPLKERKLVRLPSGLEDDVQLFEMSKPKFSL